MSALWRAFIVRDQCCYTYIAYSYLAYYLDQMDGYYCKFVVYGYLGLGPVGYYYYYTCIVWPPLLGPLLGRPRGF